MTHNDDLYEDEVMRECRERKAQVIQDYGGWEAYNKHLREDPPSFRPDGTPWPVISPEKLAALHAKPVRKAVGGEKK